MSKSSPRKKLLAGEEDIITAVAEQPAARPASVVSIDELPVYDRTDRGEMLGGMAIDYWCYQGDKLILSGWVSGTRCTEFAEGPKASDSVAICTFRRPDVELAFPLLRETARGFLAVISVGASAQFLLCGQDLFLPDREYDTLGPDRLWQDHRSRLGFLLRHCGFGAEQLINIVDQLEGAPASGQRARGHLEQARGIPGCGGLIVGWAVTLPGVKVGLLDSSGRLVLLDHAVRWHRPDIVDAFGNEFGNYTFNAGFLQGWHHPLEFGETIRLVAIDGDSCYVLNTMQWVSSPFEPTSFARWAFDFPTPLDSFFRRLDRHDGPIIQALVSAKLEARTVEAIETTHVGHPANNPRCSVIVPLYGRSDFMMNQLLEMSDDEQFKSGAELVYVVDDPRILSQVKQQAWLLHEANQVPFKIVAAGENRGFSGANNLGVSASNAPFILLLNSDVIPVEPGWLGKMMDAFEISPKIGIVGARLFYPNGSLQHDGMTFVWEPSWNAYLNKHPRAGLEPISSTSDKPSHQIAVTAACLMLRRSTYEAVGGLDESYLIGDFEDSDLCLKVRELGLDVVMVTNVNLIHLERQSFQGIGADRFREQVARYNAWKHQHRWGPQIDRLIESKDTSKR